MLDRLADLYSPFVTRIVVVASPVTRDPIGDWARARGAAVVEQSAPTGMLDAILLATETVESQRPDTVWITWADQVGLLRATLERLARAEVQEPPPAMILPTVLRADPYIHFVRDEKGRIAGLLQRREGDRMPAEGEGDLGVFALRRETFVRDLAAFAHGATAGAGTGERNFLPFVPWLAQRHTVATIPCSDPMEAVGVNTPEDLRAVEAWLQSRSGV